MLSRPRAVRAIHEQARAQRRQQTVHQHRAQGLGGVGDRQQADEAPVGAPHQQGKLRKGKVQRAGDAVVSLRKRYAGEPQR